MPMGFAMFFEWFKRFGDFLTPPNHPYSIGLSRNYKPSVSAYPYSTKRAILRVKSLYFVGYLDDHLIVW